MRFEWDEKKNQSNQQKHGLNFADAPRIFAGRTLTFEDSRQAYGEPRYLTVGSLADRLHKVRGLDVLRDECVRAQGQRRVNRLVRVHP